MILFLLLVLGAWAGKLTLDAEPNELQVGQTINLELRLVDGTFRGSPAIPVEGGVSLQFVQQSRHDMIVNTKLTRSTSYHYGLTGLKVGTWSIGPVTLLVDGAPLTADPIRVTVTERKRGDTSGVVTRVSDDHPWLGEVVLYTFEFRHEGQLLDGSWTPPDFDGFVKETSTEGTNKNYRLAQDGTPITVQEIVIPLVASGTGRHTISPSAIVAKFPETSRRRRSSPFDGLMGFTDFRTETFTGPGIDVDIRPLPLEGKPPAFTGLVGDFEIHARAKSTQVALGESITVSVVVEGTGTLHGFKLPPLPPDARFRAYDDDPQVATSLEDGKFTAKAIVERAIVPEAPGPLTIQSIVIPTFDPETGQYEELRTEPIEVMVTPGEEGGGQIASFSDASGDRRRAVETLGEDILPAPTRASMRDQTFEQARPWMIVLPVFPLCGLGILFALDLARGRVRDPWALLEARWNDMPKDPAARLQALEEIFREACALRLRVPAPGLAKAQVQPLGEAAVELYERLERARYGGGDEQALEDAVRAFVAAPR